MSQNTARVVLVAALLVLSMVSIAPAVTAGSIAPHEEGAPINYTVALSSHQPGAEEVTISQFAAGQGEGSQPNLEYWGFLSAVVPADLEYTCTTEDARAAGVDRGNDDDGTWTDESFIGRYAEEIQHENSQGQNMSTYDFYEPDSFEGESIALYEDDQIVAQLADCYYLPEKTGWYRMWGHVNGTEDGKKYQNSNAYAETNSYSHGWYVCDCESYDEAVDTLGAPSWSEEGKVSEDGQYGTMAKGWNGPWELYTAGGGGDGGGDSTATPTEDDDTATPTENDTATGDDTETPTDDDTATGDDTETPAEGTSSPAPDDDQQGTTSPAVGTTTTGDDTGVSTATDTATTGGTGDTVTATATGQPGFGIGVAVVALLAAALLVVRRD